MSLPTDVKLVQEIGASSTCFSSFIGDSISDEVFDADATGCAKMSDVTAVTALCTTAFHVMMKSWTEILECDTQTLQGMLPPEALIEDPSLLNSDGPQQEFRANRDFETIATCCNELTPKLSSIKQVS